MGKTRHICQALQFTIALVEMPLGVEIAIGACVQLDHLRADAMGRLDLVTLGCDEN